MSDYPQKVYKYRSWNNEFHQKILKDNEVYLGSPKDFNDPFDCKISTNYYLLDTPEKKSAFAKKVVQMNAAEVIQGGETLDQRYQEMLGRLTNNLDEFQEYANGLSSGFHDSLFGVLCLSEIWDNILMWSHYGDFHKGICVGFHEERLRNSGLFGKGGKVIYSESYPEIYPEYDSVQNEEQKLQKYYKQTHWKAKDWEYEQEYRLMTTFFSPPSNQQRIIKLPDDCFSEIILGIDFPVEDRAEILKIAKTKNIPVFQAVKIPFKFRMDRVKLS